MRCCHEQTSGILLDSAGRHCNLQWDHNSDKLCHSVRVSNKSGSLAEDYACLCLVMMRNEGPPYCVHLASNHKIAMGKGTSSLRSNWRGVFVVRRTSPGGCADVARRTPPPVEQKHVLPPPKDGQPTHPSTKCPSLDLSFLQVRSKTLEESVPVYCAVGVAGGLVDPPQEVFGTSLIIRMILENLFSCPV